MEKGKEREEAETAEQALSSNALVIQQSGMLGWKTRSGWHQFFHKGRDRTAQ